jgi:predicted nucleic acid-binding protein
MSSATPDSILIVDTNILSEAMRPEPSAIVLGWLAQQPVERLYTTSITQAEILSGIERMPAGRRRRNLYAHAEAMFREDFDGRILPFASEDTAAYAHIAGWRKSKGRHIKEFDNQIAAIVRSRGATLATRNIRDFEGCGIRLINPWETK